jgi:HSP20 family protein
MNNIMKRNGGLQRGSQGSSTPMTGLVDGVLSRFLDDGFWGFNGLEGRSVPVNIRETEKGYELQLVAPGLRREDFKVSMDDKMLTVSFEHQDEERKESEKGYLRQEYRVQSFARSFHLDDSVDAEKISARYENGVLWLDLPKKEDARQQRRTIEIQ